MGGGNAEGILYGGCLSILVASLGTPYEIRTEGTILFLEDLAAKPYQIDRMLMQLSWPASWTECEELSLAKCGIACRRQIRDTRCEEVVLRIVGDLGVPVAYGVPSGHVTAGNITLPIGVRAGLTVSGGQVRLKILEAAVTAAENS